MQIQVVHINSVGQVSFCKNSRSRRIRLSVSPGLTIRVSYPAGVSLEEAVGFVEQQRVWISRQQQKLRAAHPRFPEETELVTRYHRICIQRGGTKFSVKQNASRIEIFYPSSQSIDHPEVQGKVGKIMTEIYRWEARKYLPGRLKELAALHGFRYNRVTIRNNRSNWGSCSGQNNISLNLHLMKLPDHLIDYILLHELAHTRIKNHGPGFYQLLDSLTGGQAAHWKAEIRKYHVQAPEP